MLSYRMLLVVNFNLCVRMILTVCVCMCASNIAVCERVCLRYKVLELLACCQDGTSYGSKTSQDDTSFADSL